MHVTTNGGSAFPWTKSPFVYDVICVPPSAFGSCFIENVIFHNFRDNYSGIDFPNAAECGGNRAFRNHGSAASASAGTYLTKV